MDRTSRDGRRAAAFSASIAPSLSNGLPRRRHRTSLRDSLEEDGPLDLPDTSRSGLRDWHVGGKKDRERADCAERDRDRERLLRNKRRRGDGNNSHRLIHHGVSGNRGEDLGMVADESSEESVDDNEEDDYALLHRQQHTRLLQPASTVTSSAMMMLNNSRRSYPPSASAMAAAAGTAPKVARLAWKVADEMIGVSVPRKARSASAKRSHDCWLGGGATVSHASGDQAPRQPSTPPVNPGLEAALPVNNRPASPSSSYASAHKKLKPSGQKQRPPPKSVFKTTSSSATQDEIEIAEVLYGMMRQPQGPSPKSEKSFGGESVKTEVSPDESNKPMLVPNSGSILPPSNSSSAIPLVSATAPKRKKPRAIKYDDEIQAQSMYPVRNIPITAKVEMDSTMKFNSPPSTDRERGSGFENGGTYEPDKPQDMPISLANRGEDASKMKGFSRSKEREESIDGDAKEEFKESEGNTESKRSCGSYEFDNHLEKCQIDLMAPPPPTRSSPGMDRQGDSSAGADQSSIVSNGTAREEGEKTEVKDGPKNSAGGVNAGEEQEGEGRRKSAGGGDSKGYLQIDLERGDGGGAMTMTIATGSASAGAISKGNRHPVPKLQAMGDRSAPSAGPLTFPIPVAGWPGGLPPMGYMPPLPGVVSMDGSAVASDALQPPPLLFSQPRLKRCATHCYIARNISYHQQMVRIPFWPAAATAAGSVSLYVPKPSGDPNGNLSTRSNTVVDKGLFPGHSGKDQASRTTGEAQGKPVLLQQAIPPGTPGNILHGPAFMFPLSQQHAAAAAAVASARSGPSKTLNVSNAASAAGTSAGSASATATCSAVAATPGAAALSFTYPNMPGSETQYLAILQNSSYPFPVPAHVGAAPVYRGTHPQAMPFFNGPIYSSQMLHPSQLPQQVPVNLPQLQQGQGHQNASVSNGSSTPLKHLRNDQRPPGNGASGSLQGFASGKNQPLPQTLTLQPQVIQQHPHQVRSLESEVAGGDSPSTADTRIPRVNMTTVYGQNFAMPLQAPKFTLMTQAMMGGANGANTNNPDEKQQQLPMNVQHQGSKQSAIDPLQSQVFALSFGNMGNSSSAHALSLSSINQGHAILQSLPEATRQTYQIMAAAAAAQNAQQKKNILAADNDSKGGGNDASNDVDRKPLGRRSLLTAGQSITFSRPDLMDTSVASLPGNSVVESSVSTVNLGSSSSRSSAVPALVSTTPGAPSHQQLQRSQQQQMIQLQKQHQFAAARSKTPATSNGSVYSEHLGASNSTAAKYPSSVPPFPQNFVQGSGSPTQSPQWRGSARPVTSPMPSSLSPAAVTSPSLKLLSQQPVRVPPGQAHISFSSSNSKSGNVSQGQQIPTSSQQSPSSPMIVGSPTTSSVSKRTGGSPRTAASSTGNKPLPAASSLQTQQAKNSPQSMPMHKSSPIGSGSAPSILGNSPLTASSGVGAKYQSPQQQQQLSKQNLQQAQLFFSHPYVPVPAAHLTTNPPATVSATSTHYTQRRPSEQQPKVRQSTQGSAPPSSSSAML